MEREGLEAGDFADAGGVWRKESWGKIEGAAAGDLVDFGCFGAKFAGDVGGGDARAYQEDVLHVVQLA